ncbi:DUF2244 domain-containing protein [Celeribacter arenosi]|uniref:DUF2244 domain-containing protein n=1 Tax=Celeribacter arenosi TaxID=792649 RepID=A0ABP7JU01_9RHOB
MPYRWTPDPTLARESHATPAGKPLCRLDLWPHRSLPSKGFSAAIWVMFVGGMIPLIPFIGTVAFWVLLAFIMVVLAALWTALRRSDRDLLREALVITPQQIDLTHWSAKGAQFTWEANPYWVRLTLHRDAKIENYLTLKGSGDHNKREVELGAFLSPEERKKLHGELARILAQMRGAA